MFALIKLAAYALLGYCVYEFFLGLTGNGESSFRPSRRQMSQSLRDSIERETRSRSKLQGAMR